MTNADAGACKDSKVEGCRWGVALAMLVLAVVDQESPAAPLDRQDHMVQSMTSVLAVFKKGTTDQVEIARLMRGDDAGSWRQLIAARFFPVGIGSGNAEAQRYWASLYGLRSAERGEETAATEGAACWLAYAGPESLIARIAEGAYTSREISAIDDTSDIGDAILFIECRSSTACWKVQGDIKTRDNQLTSAVINKWAGSDGELVVGFADGTVHKVDANVPAEALSSFLTARGAAKHNRHIDLAEYLIQ